MNYISRLLKHKIDYCTLFPEGNWGSCCTRHDRRYDNKRITRFQADLLLFRCVRRKNHPLIAGLMWIGVRLFGWYFYIKAGQGND